MKRMKKGLAIALTLAMVISLLPLANYDSFAAKKTKISKKKITLVVGQKKKLKIKNKPSGVKVKWKSKNKKIAKVSKKGKVTAIRPGKTKIIAKVGKKKYKCRVTVKMPTIPTGGVVVINPTQQPEVTTTKEQEITVAPTTKEQEVTTIAPTQATTKAPTVAPTTKAPTVAPTTKAPTVAPTTKAPTVAPTTKAPTVVPTTKAPTTVAPTTKAPTTVAPTTKAPTTVAPTTVAPTTVAPTQAPTEAPTEPVNPTLPDVVGLTYSGNVTYPFYFAWAPSENVDGYHVFVNGTHVIDVTYQAVNLDPSLFPTSGKYTIGVQAFKGNEVSKITTTEYTYNGGDAPTQEPTTQAPTQGPTQEQTTESAYEWISIGNGTSNPAGNNLSYAKGTDVQEVVNVQRPALGFVLEDGVYVNAGAEIKSVKINGNDSRSAIQGGGTWLYLSELSLSINVISIETVAGTKSLLIKNENTGGETTVEPTQAPTTQAPTQQPTTKAPTTVAPTTAAPTTQAPTQQPTTKTPQPTTKQTDFEVDESIQKPFGIVVENPEAGIIQVNWGAGTPNCYNVYVDGVRKKTKVVAGVQRIPVQTEGNHVVAIATVSGNKESLRTEAEIYVSGTAPEEVETTQLPPELMPEIDDSIQKENGKMILQLNNKTNGQYSDSQIYWIIVGRNPQNHRMAYLTADGNLVEASSADNDGNVGGRSYSAKIVHTLSQKKAVQLPAIESGRMYLSYGEPVYITFNGEGQNVGYAGPDTNNPDDANAHTLFEYLEFTTESVNDSITFHGNVTRVDFFSFPMIARLTDEYGAYDRCVGDMKTRSETYDLFRNTVSAPFKTLITDERIMCPAKMTFGEGKQYGNYYDDYINRFWSKYASQDLTFSSETGTFTGRVSGNRIIFNNKYYIDKPSTQDVLEGRGAFNRISSENENNPQNASVELAIEAQLCAAFTRGVAMTPENWSKPETYYKTGEICNEYAAFFHPISVSNRAYGFCYDDVFDQSTLVECGNAERFTIDLKW